MEAGKESRKYTKKRGKIIGYIYTFLIVKCIHVHAPYLYVN